MTTCEYYTPTHVYFGRDSETIVGELIAKEKRKKVLLHYGSNSAKKSGLLSRIEKILSNTSLEYIELGGVQPNPRLSKVREGISLCKEHNIDFVLAIGGGSVLDSAKAIGYGVYGGGDVWDYYCGKRKVSGTLPIGAIVTMAATGSEMSNSSVITNDETNPVYKRGCSDNLGRISFAILNPELTFSVPPYQTASGASDIIMHSLERYFHKGYSLEITNELTVSLINTVIKNASIAIEHPDNYDARANLMWAACLSHNGLMQMGHDTGGDWACHQLEHELSAEYDVPHGAGLTAIWSSWAKYVMQEDPESFSLLGKCIFKESNPEKAIECFDNFFRSINMPTNLKELGLSFNTEDCMRAALGVTFQNERRIGNFKILDTEDVYNIYKIAAGLGR